MFFLDKLNMEMQQSGTSSSNNYNRDRDHRSRRGGAGRGKWRPQHKPRISPEEQSKIEYPSEINVKVLLEHGLQFGHPAGEWNPKMLPYIFGKKNGVHIIDLESTLRGWNAAKKAIYQVASNGGTILIVCTKKQGKYVVEKLAKDCGCAYVTNRWLGGMLTNFGTITRSVKMLESLEKMVTENMKFTKKELLLINRKIAKLNLSLGGIRHLKKVPDLVVILDITKEHIAVREARASKIPVVALIDTNANPELVTYPIVGNDDSIKGLGLFATAVTHVIEKGILEWENKLAAAKPVMEQKAGIPEVKPEVPAEPTTIPDKNLIVEFKT